MIDVRRHAGPAGWLRSYLTMTRWQLASLRLNLPVLTCVEVLAGVGFVLGYGLFFPGPVPARSAVHLSAGVPVITLYIVGLVFVLQVVGQQKLAQTYDFVQSMPVPRSAGFATWYTMNRGLPFGAMGTVMRAALGAGPAGDAGGAYALLAAWAAVCLGVAAVAVTRRG